MIGEMTLENVRAFMASVEPDTFTFIHVWNHREWLKRVEWFDAHSQEVVNFLLSQ